MNEIERNRRISNLIKWKMRYMFRVVLETLEIELKKSNVDKKFFDNTGGFSKVRKCLLDQGNTILSTLEIIFAEIEITPLKSLMTFSDKFMKQMKEEEERINNENKK